MTVERVALADVDGAGGRGRAGRRQTILGSAGPRCLAREARWPTARPDRRPGARPRAALSDEAEEYLSWLAVERGRARNTVVSYRRDLSPTRPPWPRGAARRTTPTPADVEDHLAACAAAGPQPASVARARRSVRGLHRFLLEEGRADAPTRPPTSRPAGRPGGSPRP